MKVGVLKETRAGETRVALVPEIAARLVKANHEILIESGAGEQAFFADADYAAAGCTLCTQEDVFQKTDVIVRVSPPLAEDVPLYRRECVLAGFLTPLGNPSLVQALAERHITSLALELIPRISRAQSMDALSAMSTVAGYRAVLLGAQYLPRFFPMLVTAAGTLAPAKALILGAGVAGLQAIASARRLGAVVTGFDVRPVVKEQVESLGATFLEAAAPLENAEDEGGYARELSKDAERRVEELVAGAVQKTDVVITTALIPGRPAPRLITADMVHSMHPGSVIVDLAAEAGGNCALTVPGEATNANGVTILGPLNLPASMPVHASQMLSRNLQAVLQHLAPEGDLKLDFEDEITSGACVTHNGEVVHPRVVSQMVPSADGGGSDG